MDEDTRAIRDELLRVAKGGNIARYSDVAPIANLDMSLPTDRSRISDMLDDISRSEHDAGRPLLSAVVIRRDTNIPGRGFFSLARELALGETRRSSLHAVRRGHTLRHPPGPR